MRASGASRRHLPLLQGDVAGKGAILENPSKCEGACSCRRRRPMKLLIRGLRVASAHSHSRPAALIGHTHVAGRLPAGDEALTVTVATQHADGIYER